MSVERSNIEFPLWRKKVDGSLLSNKVTVIPRWLYQVWGVNTQFTGVSSKTDARSLVEILFNSRRFQGHVTSTQPTGRTSAFFRLHFGDDLQEELRDTFLMSYIRSIEGDLRNIDTNKKVNIESEISFWEFIDIEFDQSTRIFLLTAHYTQQPQFGALFKRLTRSPAMKTVRDEIADKEKDRIHKQGWKLRREYKSEIGAENVIYMLIDTLNKLIYLGEAKNLIRRFDAGHSEIKDWDYYKYNVLPKSLERHRITIERMVIRDLAALFPNRQNIESKSVSDYRLVNRKIDK